MEENSSPLPSPTHSPVQNANPQSAPIPTEKKSDTALIISSVVFFPFGLFYAWNKGALDRVLPTVTIVFSVLNLAGALLTLTQVSGLQLLYSTLGVNSSQLWNTTLFYMGIISVVCIVGIIYGYITRKKIHQGPYQLTQAEKIILLVALTAPFIIIAPYINAVALPILNGINNLGSGNLDVNGLAQ